MKLNRCPICHSVFDVMALAQDEATQKVLLKIAPLDTLTGTALLGYLALFNPAKSQLSASRALALIEELEALDNWQRLGVAMATIVQTMHNKRQNGHDVGQYKNHNYLKRVLEGMDDNAGQSLAPVTAVARSAGRANTRSKTMGALQALEDLKDD